MISIRRLTCFDYSKLKKLISYLCTDDNDKLVKTLMEEPIGIINGLLPLHLKFKSESYILVDGKEILGLITTNRTQGNPYKINITRLIFKENMYDIGRQLVNFVVKKYGKKGATSFAVTIDECHEELFDLFIHSCGFRQCASETLWKIEKPEPKDPNIHWRYAQDSDADRIADLYNSELLNIYRPSLVRYAKEFKSPFFAGFTNYYKTRFVIEETEKILGYGSVTTSDNLNYILDITTNSGYELNYEDIINVMMCEIARKKKAFYPIIKQKKYLKNSEHFENYLKSNKYVPIQTQQILVKDFYRQVKEEAPSSWKVFLLGENEVHGV